MKNWKHGTSAVLIVTLAIAAFSIACDNGGGSGGGGTPSSTPCTCAVKAHLGMSETCVCGGKPCNCTEEKSTTANPGITVRRDKTITSAQMTAKISGDIATALNGLTSAEKVTLGERLTEIHIVPGIVPGNETIQGTIMKIGINETAEMIEAYFSVIVAQAPQKPAYYMAQSDYKSLKWVILTQLG